MEFLSRARKWSYEKRMGVLFTPVICATLFYSVTSPVRLPESYHEFADNRQLIPHIPNTLNVLSSIPFLVIGVYALLEVNHRMTPTKWEKMTWNIFFTSVIATFFGSAFYYLWPNNHSLFWDIFPIAVACAALVATSLYECISEKLGRRVLIPAILFNCFSVLYWYFFNDLRFYSLSQFLTCYLISVVPVLFPSRYSKAAYYELAVIFFIIAKLCEGFDRLIFILDWNTVSGHTLKHLLSSLSGFLMTVMLRRRHLTPPPKAKK